jgi:hypothetical protein
MSIIRRIVRFTKKSRREKIQSLISNFKKIVYDIKHYKVARNSKDKTVYIIGLFGTGRSYINKIILENIGDRTSYLREGVRCHRGRTSMIYSGHATIKYISCGQRPPKTTQCILKSVKAGHADLIFVYRHPIDSLLTNWIWWRTYINNNYDMSASISEKYRNIDNLCKELEENFMEFEAFSRGDAAFFVKLMEPPFLSFSEFVEETLLYIEVATLALRLEDFMTDPVKEFYKIANLMSINLDLKNLRIARPQTKPYRYLLVKKQVKQFKLFIDNIDEETKNRIETLGYTL